MSKKKENVFSEAGLSEQDVKAWQKTKPNLAKVSDKALAQLYSRVVLGKQIKKPYPIFTVGKLWEEINAVNSGQKIGSSRKLFVGVKDVMVVGLSNAIKYVGCPKCLKGHKKIGASKCAGHGTELVELEELSWNEWLVYDDDDEFIVKMSPNYMKKYHELNMIGGMIYVDGVVDLDVDPILLMVNYVRDFTPGSLMPGAPETEGEEGDDFTVGREEVDLDGFDEEDEAVVKPSIEEEEKEANPFLVDDTPVEETKSGNGSSPEFKKDLLRKFGEAMQEFAVNPVKFIQVERYMLDWVEQKYPMEFTDNEIAVKKLWELTDGHYKKVDDERLQRII